MSYRSHPYSGGQGIYIKHLSKALSVRGHQVSVLSGPPYPELDESVELIKTAISNFLNSSSVQVRIQWFLVQLRSDVLMYVCETFYI